MCAHKSGRRRSKELEESWPGEVITSPVWHNSVQNKSLNTRVIIGFRPQAYMNRE